MKSLEICPSILNASNIEKFLTLLNEINEKQIEKIIYIHLDIMDNIFVDGKGIEFNNAKLINSFGFISDIHLMVEDAKGYIDKALEYNPAVITIHFESKNFQENLKLLNEIRNSKKYSYFDIGVSLNPNTKIELLVDYIDMFDVLLLMSVEPGKGGQAFTNTTYEKIKEARILFENKIIQVDGGINDKNISTIKKAGADRLVIGSYLTKNTNIKELEESLKNLREGI